MDQKKLDEFLGKAIGEWGAALDALLIFVGDKLGLYQAMSENSEAFSPEELALRTRTHPRMITEWLKAQASGGYITYDSANGTYSLPEEHADAFTNVNSQAYIQGCYQVLISLFKDEEKIIEAMKTGKGFGWGDHHPYLFEGTERFFRPNYVANLTNHWIPSLEGVEEKLKNGAKVADVGCGHGVTTILMAKEYPKSQIIGFDFHEKSIDWARKEAEREGLKNITFEVGGSTSFPGDDYDLVTFFDCLHDMGDPAGAAKHVLRTLTKKNGTCMIVEPFAHDRTEDNLNPIGRVFYAASTMVCVPASLKENGPALGAQAGEAKIGEIIREAGFSKFRRSAQTPFNLVFEAKV